MLRQPNTRSYFSFLYRLFQHLTGLCEDNQRVEDIMNPFLHRNTKQLSYFTHNYGTSCDSLATSPKYQLRVSKQGHGRTSNNIIMWHPAWSKATINIQTYKHINIINIKTYKVFEHVLRVVSWRQPWQLARLTHHRQLTPAAGRLTFRQIKKEEDMEEVASTAYIHCDITTGQRR